MTKKHLHEDILEKERLAVNLKHKLEQISAATKDLAHKAKKVSNDTRHKVERTTKKHPLKSLGIATAIGFALGYLIKRRK